MLGVTQPTLSESVRRLEKHLGVTLFYRSKSGIELTSQGRVALDKVQSLINSVYDLESVGTGSHLTQQSYRIGCHPVVGRYFLTKSMQQLHRKYQNTTINLIHSHSRDIQTQIQEGKIDIGVVVNPIKNPDLIIKPICLDRIHIWQSTNKNVRSDQLVADMGLAQVQALLRSWGKAPAKHIDTNDFNLIAQLCLGGMGYAILPKRFVKMERLKLKKCFEHINYKDEFALVYRPEFGKQEIEKYIVQSISSSF